MREESQKTKEIKTEPIPPEMEDINEADVKIREVMVEIDDDNESIDKIIYPDLENKFLLVRVGTNSRPAEAADIEDVQEKLGKMLKDNGINCLVFVTHHAVIIDILEKRGI